MTQAKDIIRLIELPGNIVFISPGNKYLKYVFFKTSRGPHNDEEQFEMCTFFTR